VRATWLDPKRRSCQQTLDARFVEIPVPRSKAHDGPLTRQRTDHEHRFAVDMRDTAAIMGKIGDFDFWV